MKKVFVGYAGVDVRAAYPGRTHDRDIAWRVKTYRVVVTEEMPATPDMIRYIEAPVGAGVYTAVPAAYGTRAAGLVEIWLEADFRQKGMWYHTPDGSVWLYHRVEQPNFYTAGRSYMECVRPA